MLSSAGLHGFLELMSVLFLITYTFRQLLAVFFKANPSAKRTNFSFWITLQICLFGRITD